MKRREFFHSASATLAGGALVPGVLGRDRGPHDRPTAALPSQVVDRRARVARHSPVVRVFDSFSALSVGNGSFAFTADATGLQTFADDYKEIPLATQAEWGWHSYP